MATTYRNSSVATLQQIAQRLMEQGFGVGPVVVPENPWVDGNPYLTTSASNRDIFEAIKALR